jgi:hypothetical protein
MFVNAATRLSVWLAVFRNVDSFLARAVPAKLQAQVARVLLQHFKCT